MAASLTILISGMMAAVPRQGGATWAVLQYLLGFRQLGHHVYFVEPIREEAQEPTGAPFDRSTAASYFREVVSAFDLDDAAALVHSGTHETVGLSYAALREVARRANLLVNISGILKDKVLTDPIPLRVYLDLDPGFNQLWHTQGIDMGFAGHTHFVTVGQAVGKPTCLVPPCGLRWLTTLQPVVLAWWPPAGRITRAALTTVGNWRGYGSIEHVGVCYGQKAHSLRRFITLPQRTDERFALALAIHPKEITDLLALADNGWQILDPLEVAGTPGQYQAFVQGSKAEFGLTKSGYVAGRSGWFSDRSACYLASGRPVIAQETGFSEFLPTGAGLFAFQGADQVLEGIEALRRDYAGQCRGARAIAEEYFDSNKVLNRLLREIGAAS